jgi:YkoY family integral membrane protein
MNEFFHKFPELWDQIISNPIPSLIVVGNLILIESLLSVDNAAVLATMVMDLPKEQREKALKYGIWGAYFFRGLAMIFAAILIEIWWLKPLGGLYLLYLSVDWLIKKLRHKEEHEEVVDKKKSKFYQYTVGALGPFWATVVLVELMDMAFSIDNVFAAVAVSKNIILVCLGVFIGILAMRFVAQSFVKLMEKYTFLEWCAYLVIAVLGIKLVLSLFTHFYPCHEFSMFMEGSHACLVSKNITPPEEHEMVWGDIITSILTVSIFFVPVMSSILFNFPRKHVVGKDDR